MSERPESAFYCTVTPPGRGAIASTMLWGPAAQELLQALFRPANRQRSFPLPPGTLVYGHWVSPEQTPSEDVVISVLVSGKIGIHSHGGRISQQLIARDLEAAGARLISPATFTEWESEDFWTAELTSALQQASTEFAAKILLDQLALWPSVANDLNRWVEDGDFLRCRHLADELFGTAALARHLVQPWRVVLCGAPNVGKSSLLNAMVGFERVIVSEIPGTTRDVVRHATAIGGWPVELSDTAGVREATGAIERSGIAAGLSEIERSDCAVAVFDASLPWTAADTEFLERIQPDLILFNKADVAVTDSARPPGLLVSARDRTNLPALLDAIQSVLVPRDFDGTRPLLVTEGMVERLATLLADLENRQKQDH